MLLLKKLEGDTLKEKTKNIRESNFELLRITSMILIILYHIIHHGNTINNSTNESIKIILTIIRYITLVHVNSFIILTGYFQSTSKFKISKVVKLISQILFYIINIYIIAIKLGLIKNYNYLDILNCISISAIGEYWFITNYLILYIFSDYINKFINAITKKQIENFIIITFVIFSLIPIISGGKILNNDGFNFYNFIYLYIIGAYLKLYPIKENYYFKRLSKQKYRILLIFIFILCVYLNYSLILFSDKINNTNLLFTQIASKIYKYTLAYSNPFTIIQTICYFELFKSINIKNKLINYLSKYTFGVYLIHDSNIARNNIYKILKIDRTFSSYKMIPYIFFITILIFILCTFIEILRAKLFDIIINLTKKTKKYKNNTKNIKLIS